MQWPPTDPKLAREALTLLADVERALAVWGQSSSPADGYMNPFDMLGRLLAVGLGSVPFDVAQFYEQVGKFGELLPPASMSASFLHQYFRQENKEAAQALQWVVYHLYWLAKWYSQSCPSISIEGNLAASLMATEVSQDAIHEVMFPWECFVVRLPRDLIDLGQLKFTHLAVHRHRSVLDTRWVDDIPDDQKERALEFYERKMGDYWSLYGVSDEQIGLARTDLPRVLVGKERKEYLLDYLNNDHPDRDETPDDRIVQALARLVVGISYLAENQPKALRPKSTKKQRHRRWRFNKLPLTTEYVLAPDVPIRFDCTEAIGAYLRGDRKAPPKFQWIVRGHWRNQVHGPGRTGRKRIWIQPYWKGPEDARRLFREYRFEGKGE